MRGRLPHHFNMNLYVKGSFLPLVIEGVLDMDEGYFDISTAYLQKPRHRVEGRFDYDLPEAVHNAIMSGKYDEDINDAAWGSY